jgi:hypothetical protein
MPVLRRWTAYAAVATMTASVLVFGGATASADLVGVPSLVDDGAYPGAAEILAEQNVQLVAGDGHVQLADCATPPVGDIGLLKVYTTDESIGADGIGRVCFQVTGGNGWLSLHVPGVYEIRGDGQRTGTGHEVTADLVSDKGEHITVDVDPDGSTQVGLGADPNASPTMLLQLRSGDGLAPVTGSAAAIGKATVGERECTVSLVAPQWVLGAASCFAADPVSPSVVDAPLTGTNGVVLPGHAKVGLNYVSPRTGRDVALARLASQITDVTPLAVAASAAPMGTSVTATGFGRSETDWVYAAQQSPQITFTASTVTTLTASSGPLVCKGMAGAPVLVGGAIAAVLSQGGQNGCFDTAGTTGTDVTAARTDGLGTWVTTSVSSLQTGQTLRPLTSLLSPDYRFQLWLQDDGNLVLYLRYGPALWATGTRGGERLVNQADGNLVLYRADGSVAWSSGTYGNGPSALWLQDDGNLVLYRNSDAKPTWASGTVVG